MGRKELIKFEDFKSLVERYFYEVQGGNTSKLKRGLIVEYVKNHGYPNFTPQYFNNHKEFGDFVSSLKSDEPKNSLKNLVVYKPLDIDAFLDTHKSKDTIKQGLAQLDAYYKGIVDSAVKIQKEYSRYDESKKRYQGQIQELNEKLTIANNKVKSKNKENKELKETIKMLRAVVNDYVYPDIANELLAKSGELKDVETCIDKEKLEPSIITSDTVIENESKCDVIDFLSKKFED